MNAGAPSPSEPDFTGRTVEGKYRIEGALGSGAVGTVFSATELSTGRRAAVKIWHSTGEEKQSRARFVREAKALNTLKHPNIVEVYGAGLFEDQPYVAMEFLEGETLEDQLAPTLPLAPDDVVYMARQILSALAFAHKHGVVHRDLKPENIFLASVPDGRPRVKLLDYGLAKFLGAGDDPLGGAQITMTGMVMGTPLYMPPEQAAGAKVDLRVDVYAAGCILFEMFSGRLPFLGNDFGQLMRAHLLDPIPQLDQVLKNNWVATELQTLFDTAMAKDPAERYPDASSMLAAFEMLPRPAVRERNGRQQAMRESAVVETSTSAESANLGTGMLLGVAVGLAALIAVALLLR